MLRSLALLAQHKKKTFTKHWVSITGGLRRSESYKWHDTMPDVENTNTGFPAPRAKHNPSNHYCLRQIGKTRFWASQDRCIDKSIWCLITVYDTRWLAFSFDYLHIVHLDTYRCDNYDWILWCAVRISYLILAKAERCLSGGCWGCGEEVICSERPPNGTIIEEPCDARARLTAHL